MNESTIMNTREAAAYLQVKPDTLERWRIKGSGPGFSKAGRLVRYRKETLDEWLASKTQTRTQEQSKP